MNRIDRVTAILIQLQSRKIVKAQEIADRFNISLRTVYRDIRTLEEAGIPLIGEAGIGYSIMDGYRLPPIMFSKEEATAFLTAEKLVEKLTDPLTEKSYKSAMYKVRAVLRTTEQDMLEHIEERIQVLQHPPSFGETSTLPTIPEILRSISERRMIEIEYHAFHSEEYTKRKVEPIGIFYLSGFWHIIAFCHLRKDYRDFRTDRINALTITEDHFSQDHPSLQNYLEQLRKQRRLEKVVINVQPRITKYLREGKYYHGFVSEESTEDNVQMTFLISESEPFVRWFLMFADAAEIVDPPGLLVLVQEYLSKLTEKFS